MSLPTGRREVHWKAIALGALLGTAAASAVVVIQAGRGAWPFEVEVEHSRGTKAGTVQAQRAGGKASEPHAAHVRAPVSVDAVVLDRLGIRTARVSRDDVTQRVRAVATVVPDESRLSHVHTRVAGWIERLHVSTTGQKVRAGRPLVAIFSQELVASQTELVSARRAAAGEPSALLEGSRSRLRVLGMSDAEIAAVERTGQVKRLVTVVAPRSGIVLHRGIAVGTAVDPSTEILQVADLSRVWLLAEVPEADVPYIQLDSRARIDIRSSGQPAFEADVAFVYPTLTERTRTRRVRFEVDNRDGRLLPGMYGEVSFDIAPRQTLTVPRDAVVDTGMKRHVFVATAPGRFEPRAVELGVRTGERIEVRAGLTEGEQVVASGVFLIDSESRLRGSGGAGGHGGGGHGGGGHGGDAGGGKGKIPEPEHGRGKSGASEEHGGAGGHGGPP